jgi:dimeric dUTPase (all-alpha-NTP-PPase superfamily)
VEKDLIFLFEKQHELDERIIKEHGLERRDLVDEKIIALLVEISELANETRCFKFWSKKPPSGKDITLEEFADGTCFFISLAIDLGIKPEEFAIECIYSFDNINAAFLELYQIVSFLPHFDDGQELQLHEAFSLYVYIGERFLGFSWKEIMEAYKRKNEINHQRQDNGY